jgi:lipoxygenase
MLKICMKILQEWPLKSKLDPKIYGPPESAITTEMIQKEIGGIMTVKEVRSVTQYYDKTL